MTPAYLCDNCGTAYQTTEAALACESMHDARELRITKVCFDPRSANIRSVRVEYLRTLPGIGDYPMAVELHRKD